MKYEIVSLKDGSFQLRVYKKFLWMKQLSSVYNGDTIDDLLDEINRLTQKKEPTIAELMHMKQRLQADLDAVTRKIREKVYK